MRTTLITLVALLTTASISGCSGGSASTANQERVEVVAEAVLSAGLMAGAYPDADASSTGGDSGLGVALTRLGADVGNLRGSALGKALGYVVVNGDGTRVICDANGHPLRYRNPSATAAGGVDIWSIGNDAIDDGGTGDDVLIVLLDPVAEQTRRESAR